MKLLISILLAIPVSLSAQNDSLKILQAEICQNLFADSMVDSSYSHFYINEKIDTVFFNSVHCIRSYLITDPFGTTLWKTKDGFANGLYQYNYQVYGEWTIIRGEFSNGHFLTGTEENYHSNGRIKSYGAIKNGRSSGVWRWYTKDGLYDHKAHITNGIGAVIYEK